MIVKSDKSVHVTMGVVAAGLLVIFLISWVKYGMIITFLMGGILLCFLCQWFSIGKTLIMDSEGCTVQILCFSKKYLWENLKIKRIERWNGQGHLPGEVFPVERRGVIFSKNQISKSEKTRPEDYSMFKPFFMSCFFVYFSMEQPLMKNGSKVYEIYSVDEEKFMDKMQEWNVKLDVVMEQNSPFSYTDDYFLTPDKLKEEQEMQESIKEFVRKENLKLRDSIDGFNKCRIYKVLEFLKYNDEAGVFLNCGEKEISLRCIFEKKRNGQIIKTFYVEDQRYEELEGVRKILESNCDENGFVNIGLVDSSLLDCKIRRMWDAF